MKSAFQVYRLHGQAYIQRRAQGAETCQPGNCYERSPETIRKELPFLERSPETIRNGLLFLERSPETIRNELPFHEKEEC